MHLSVRLIRTHLSSCQHAVQVFVSMLCRCLMVRCRQGVLKTKPVICPGSWSANSAVMILQACENQVRVNMEVKRVLAYIIFHAFSVGFTVTDFAAFP